MFVVCLCLLVLVSFVRCCGGGSFCLVFVVWLCVCVRSWLFSVLLVCLFTCVQVCVLVCVCLLVC